MDANPEAMEAHPGATKAHSGVAGRLTIELWRYTLKPWRLTLLEVLVKTIHLHRNQTLFHECTILYIYLTNCATAPQEMNQFPA
jgi:hypothetical protein